MNKIARIGEVLEFLKTLIHSSDHGTVRISKTSLVDIRPCLHNVQENIEFCSLRQSYGRKNYSSGVIILNLFMFRRLKQTPIKSKTIMLQFIQI